MESLVGRCYLSVFIFMLTASGLVRADTIKVYILAGQSNMVGSGDGVGLPTDPVDLRLPQDDVLGYQLLNSEQAVPYQRDWENLRPRGSITIQNQKFGPEILFGRTVADALDDPTVALIKFASNGTNLFADWDPDATEGDLLYSRMIDTVGVALSDLVTLGWAPQVAGLVWVQGSSDAHTSAHAIAYEANLNGFIARTRADLGQPALPVVLNLHHINARHSFRIELRQSQSNVAAADPRVGLISLDDQALKADDIHFTTETQIVAGTRLAQAYFQFLAQPGDVSNNGVIGPEDVDAFIQALAAEGDEAAFVQSVATGSYDAADLDADGFVSHLDIPWFVDTLLDAGVPSGSLHSLTSLPEPTGLALLVTGGIVILARRARRC